MKPLALLKIPQILGAGLAANVFIAIAAQIKVLDTATWPAYAALSYAFALNLKDFFDDMKSYEVTEMEGFSLFPTVTFRVLSYLTIAWAVSLLPNYQKTFQILSIYFLVFIAWSSNSVIRRVRLQSSTHENSERLRRRKGWIVIYVTSACGCLAIGSVAGDLYIALLLILLAAMFSLDAIDSDTFSSKINETL